MHNPLHKPEIQELIERRDFSTLRDSFVDRPAAEVAELLLELDKPDRVLLYRSLPRSLAADVVSELDMEHSNALLKELTDEETRHLLSTMPPDDRIGLLEELPGLVVQRLLNLLSPSDLREVRTLLGYPEESVGRLMTPDYVAVRPGWTVAQALVHIRGHGKDSETISRIFIVDQAWRLLDDVALRRLILADPESLIEDIMDHSFAALSVFADREEAVRMIQKYNVVALPVVDSDGVLVGIVTVDDILDVAEEEATEDFHKAGSVEPIFSSLRDARVSMLYRRRVGWLLILVGMNVFSGAAIAMYEDLIAASVALVFFLPLLIDSAGNVGSQASTLMIRALATGDVQGRDWFKMLAKELGVALLLGLTMAMAISPIGFVRGGGDIAMVVALTMLVVVIMGGVVGVALPFILGRFKLDPATASSPLVTSIADLGGVLIYFTIASQILELGAP